MDYRHDAFISYGHAVDAQIAPALQRGMERIAKPMLKLRAMSVFRDQTSLTATPALWPGIVEHLASSEWFLLLASPASAASKWCNRELGWWLDNRASDRLLVLLTEGEIVWDPAASDFDWQRTTALPPVLRGRLADEPLYVDLRWARDSPELSLRNARFREAVVKVAAPIRGMRMDDLDGEDLRQLARNRRLVRGGIAAVCIAAALAVWQAIVATDQRQQAERQRDIAIARQLAAQASLMEVQQPQRLPLALLMAIQSTTRSAESLETQQTVRGVLARFPRPRGVVMHDSAVTSVALSPDLSLLASATAKGDSGLWRLADGRRIAGLGGGHQQMMFGPRGRRIAGCCEPVSVWDAQGAPQLVLSASQLEGKAEAIAFSPDGTLLAIGVVGKHPGFAIYDLATREAVLRRSIDLSGHASAITFTPAGDLAVALRDTIDLHAAGDWSLTKTLDPDAGAIRLLAASPNGRYLASGGGGRVSVFDLKTHTLVARLELRGGGPGEIRQLLFDPHSRFLGAVGELNTGAIWTTGQWRELTAIDHGEFQTIHSLSFDPSQAQAISCGSDGSCQGWSLRTGRRSVRFAHAHPHTAAPVPNRSMLSGVFGVSGSLFASGGADGSARLWEVTRHGQLARSRCDGDVLTRSFVALGRAFTGGHRDAPQLIARDCGAAPPAGVRPEAVVVDASGRFAAAAVAVDRLRVWQAQGGPTPGAVLSEIEQGDGVDWNAVLAKLLARGASERAARFNVEQMRDRGTLRALAVSPTGRRAASLRQADGSLRIVDTATGEVLHRETLAANDTPALEFLSDAAVLRAHASGALSMLPLEAAMHGWSVSVEGLSALAVAADASRIAAAGRGANGKTAIRVLAASSGKLLLSSSIDAPVDELTFDHSGRYLLILSGDSAVVPEGLPPGLGLVLLELSTGNTVVALPRDDAIIAVDLSADGTRLATMGVSGALRVFDLPTGRVRQTVLSDPGPIAFSANGDWLAVGRHALRILDSNELRPLAQLDFETPIRWIRFRDQDRSVAVALFEPGETPGVLEVHRWRRDDLLREACERLPLDSAEAQWRQLYPEQAPPSPCARQEIPARADRQGAGLE